MIKNDSRHIKSEKDQCSGCGLCTTACINNAITLEKDEYGFLYPTINNSKCINCNACVRICPFTNDYLALQDGGDVHIAYAFKNTETIRKHSASGGFFSYISDYVLKENGVVYGAIFDNKLHVKHDRATTTDERDQMRGSKYIQSNLMSVFNELIDDIKSDRWILFSGTPCQCAAIKKKIDSLNYDKIIYVELICHGVVSEQFFEEYISEINHKYGKRIVSYNFRDKKYGWQTVSGTFDDGTTYYNKNDYFYPVYSMHVVQRPSCYKCVYANNKRISDFTIGDFWGADSKYPEIYDKFGISLVLVNTKKGRVFLDQMQKAELDGVFYPLTEELYLEKQPNLNRPTPLGPRYVFFWKYFNKLGYKKTMKRFFEPTLQRRINTRLAHVLHSLGIKKL